MRYFHLYPRHFVSVTITIFSLAILITLAVEAILNP